MSDSIDVRLSLVGCFALLVATAGLATGTGLASAQVAVDGNATASPTPAPIVGTVGGVEIRSYSVVDGEFRLLVHADEPIAYAVSDALAGLRSSGVTTVPMKKGVLSSGTTRLTLDVQIVDGASAITLSTPADAVRIQDGSVSSDRPPVPFGQAILGIAVAGIGSGYVAFRRTRDKLTEDDEPEVKRLA